MVSIYQREGKRLGDVASICMRLVTFLLILIANHIQLQASNQLEAVVTVAAEGQATDLLMTQCYCCYITRLPRARPPPVSYRVFLIGIETWSHDKALGLFIKSQEPLVYLTTRMFEKFTS